MEGGRRCIQLGERDRSRFPQRTTKGNRQQTSVPTNASRMKTTAWTRRAWERPWGIANARIARPSSSETGPAATFAPSSSALEGCISQLWNQPVFERRPNSSATLRGHSKPYFDAAFAVAAALRAFAPFG
ncbi:MAG: hypothetical protein U0414_25160 [Polyangiaceae bacterium]